MIQVYVANQASFPLFVFSFSTMKLTTHQALEFEQWVVVSALVL